MTNEEYTAALSILKQHCSRFQWRLLQELPDTPQRRESDHVNLDDCISGVWKKKGVSKEIIEAGEALQAVLPDGVGPQVSRQAVNCMAQLLSDFILEYEWSLPVQLSNEKAQKKTAKKLQSVLNKLQAPTCELLARDARLEEPGGLDRLLLVAQKYPDDKVCSQLVQALTSLGAGGRRDIWYSLGVGILQKDRSDIAMQDLKAALIYAKPSTSQAVLVKDSFYRWCIRLFIELGMSPSPSGPAWKTFRKNVCEELGLSAKFPASSCKDATKKIMGQQRPVRDNWLLLERLQVFCTLTEGQESVCRKVQHRLSRR